MVTVTCPQNERVKVTITVAKDGTVTVTVKKPP
jgi:ribosomal protein L11